MHLNNIPSSSQIDARISTYVAVSDDQCCVPGQTTSAPCAAVLVWRPADGFQSGHLALSAQEHKCTAAPFAFMDGSKHQSETVLVLLEALQAGLALPQQKTHQPHQTGSLSCLRDALQRKHWVLKRHCFLEDVHTCYAPRAPADMFCRLYSAACRKSEALRTYFLSLRQCRVCSHGRTAAIKWLEITGTKIQD